MTRTGFLCDASSLNSSFILRKDFMSEDEIAELHKNMFELTDIFETIGETENFFFGIIEDNNEFSKWLKNKHFIGIEWS